MEFRRKRPLQQDLVDAKAIYQGSKQAGSKSASVNKVRLTTFGGGLGLIVEVKVDGKWRQASDELYNAVAVRHIDAAAHALKVPARSSSLPERLVRGMSLRVVPSFKRRSATAQSDLSTSPTSSAQSLLSMAGEDTTPLSTPAESLRAASPNPSDQKELDSYLEDMAKPKTYGGSIELRALAEAYGRPIYVVTEMWQKDVKSGELVARYGCYEAHTPLAGSSASPMYVVQQSKVALRRGAEGSTSLVTDEAGAHYKPLIGLAPFDAVQVGSQELAKMVADHARPSVTDGSCLFDSIRQLSGDVDVQQVRARAVGWLKEFATTYDDPTMSLMDAIKEANGLRARREGA